MKKNTNKKSRVNIKLIVLIVIALILGYAIYNQQQAKVLEDEKFILNPPPKEASKSALKKHAQMVKKLAKQSNSLEIKDCNPNPLVLRTQLGSNLEIKNQSETHHRIIIDSKHYYDVPKNSSKVIKAEFKYGTGDYGYVCEGEGKAKIAGFLHVVP